MPEYLELNALSARRKRTLDIYLRIQHGSVLHLPNITEKRPDEPITCVVMGPCVLESIGCDNEKMVEAACKRSSLVIDVDKELAKDSNMEESKEAIVALSRDSMSHNPISPDDDGVADRHECTKFGLYSQKDIDGELEIIIEALAQGFLKAEVGISKALTNKHQGAFRIRLGDDVKADIATMKITVDASKKLVRVKIRKYLTEQWRFLDTYFEQLVKVGYLRPNPHASWKAAPHPVAKESTRFRVTIDLKMVNMATTSDTWPAPTSEAELANFVWMYRLCNNRFLRAYWQIPLDPESYDACGIIAPNVVLRST